MDRLEQKGKRLYAPLAGSGEAYHLGELKTVLDPTDAAHILPPPLPRASRVLDVGCGAGQTLIAAYPDRIAFGLDVDIAALQLGQTLTQNVRFVCGQAEALPYRSGTFDFVVARVSLVYTAVPASLNEIRRVLRPGGSLWMTLHVPSVPLALAKRAGWKGKIYFGYILANSILLHFFQRQFSFRGRYESFQTEAGMRRLLRRCGFSDVRAVRGVHFLMTAQASE